MLNLKQNFYIMGSIALIALAACSSDNPSTAGSTTIPNATAEISSSSDNTIESSSSLKEPIGKQDYVFTTAPTAKRALPQGELVVYGLENGATASCSAGKYASTKEYIASIVIIDGETMERNLWLGNFGDACNDILNAFKESCSSGLVEIVPDAACNENGDLKAFCYASKTDSIRTCDSKGDCISAGADPTIDFNTLLNEFTMQSNEICGNIANGVDSTEYDLPVSEPDSSIKANSSRAFIIEPNTENLEVSDEEQAFLDSIAMTFPGKYATDEIDGMTLIINEDAEYQFTTAGKSFILNESDNTCTGGIYQEESGVTRYISKYGDWRSTHATILLVSGNAIVYLVNDDTGSALEPFQTECSATKGSFYNYSDKAAACAVKNFTRIPFETIVSEQGNLCQNNYSILPAFNP